MRRRVTRKLQKLSDAAKFQSPTRIKMLRQSRQLVALLFLLCLLRSMMRVISQRSKAGSCLKSLTVCDAIGMAQPCIPEMENCSTLQTGGRNYFQRIWLLTANYGQRGTIFRQESASLGARTKMPETGLKSLTWFTMRHWWTSHFLKDWRQFSKSYTTRDQSFKENMLSYMSIRNASQRSN